MIEVFKILANKVNGKAPVVMTAMFLIYSIAIAETVTHGLLAMGIITGLCVFYSGIQAIIELKLGKKEDTPNTG